MTRVSGERRVHVYQDLPPIQSGFFAALRRKPDHSAVRSDTVPNQWEGFRTGLRGILMPSMPDLVVTYADGQLTMPTTYPAKESTTDSAYGAMETAFKTVPPAIWELFTALHTNVIPNMVGRERDAKYSFIFTKKGGVVEIKIKADANNNTHWSRFVFFTPGNPVLGESFDVLFQSLYTSERWHNLMHLPWGWGQSALDSLASMDMGPAADAQQDLRLMQGLNELLQTHPGVIWYEGSHVDTGHLGRLGLLWSTHPDQRAQNIVQLLKTHDLDKLKKDDPLRQALDINVLECAEPIVIRVHTLPAELA